MHTTRHKLLVFLCTISLCGLWISCQPEGHSTSGKRVFRMNLNAGLSTLDPAFARDQAAGWMCAQLFEGLTELDSNLIVQPLLAKNWGISQDAKTYTFTLKQGIFFHKHPAFGQDSSRQVIASDFVYSFERICNPQTASTGQWIFNGKIAGLADFQAGEAEHVSGFRAIDDTTLQIELTRPFPAFLSLLAMPYCYVVPQEIVEIQETPFQEQAIGTGPFRFFAWEDGNYLIFHKNPNYHQNELPKLDAISVSFIPSRLSAFVEFQQKKLDFINGIDNSFKDEVLQPNGEIRPKYAEQYQFQLRPQLNTEYLAMLIDSSEEIVQNHPLADVRVRKALNYAIDREKMVKYLLNGMGYAAHSGFVPKGMPGFDAEAVQGYSYQPEKARELLQEAGYPNGTGIELTLYSTPNYQHISEFVQKAFAQIGVDASIQNMQGGALRRESKAAKLNFWRASWIADYPDGENYLSLFYSPNHTPNGPNITHFQQPQFDSLYNRSLSITQDSNRYQLYQQMDRLMIADAPVILLYYDRIFRMLQPDIKGLQTNAMNHLILKYVEKEADK